MRYFLLSIFICLSVISKCAPKDSIALSYELIDLNTVEVTVYNNSNSPAYLFDSYLKGGLYRSKYLHRYNEEDNTYKLSLIPLLPYLTVEYSHPIVEKLQSLGRVINYGEVTFGFQTIEPQSNYSFTIFVKDIIDSPFVYDIDLKNIDYLPPRQLFRESKTIENPHVSSVTLELAIYKNINVLINNNAYHFDCYNYNQKAKDYKIISIVLENLFALP